MPGTKVSAKVRSQAPRSGAGLESWVWAALSRYAQARRAEDMKQVSRALDERSHDRFTLHFSAELAEYLGHSDPAFTLRVYAHMLPYSHDRARAVINERFT